MVRLDPGLAFGSGTHPTTALCLAWLDALAADGWLHDAEVLDFGCGSGPAGGAELTPSIQRGAWTCKFHLSFG